ncbi:MAG: VOC family protein [Trueperaceae bacterium]|jgi:hypothetical protein|nr:VOC family protein [Truepera sp.]
MPTAIDHLLFAGPDLPTLKQQLEQLSGLAPAGGGRHEGFGTHNALLGLDADRYLELMAPDPASPSGAFADAIAYLDGPALHTYCARVDDLGALCARARAVGLEATESPGSRVRPDGSLLEWTLTFVTGHPYGGHFPFFIDWRGSAHPSAALRAGLRLTALWLEHPDAAGLAKLLREVAGFGGSNVSAAGELRPLTAVTPRLRADFTGLRGDFCLGGGGAGMRR